MNPAGLRYSKEHEWVRKEPGNVVVTGITGFAAESLGDVVFLDLPDVGAQVTQFEKLGEIESVKAVSDLYSPVSGSVLERNEAAIEGPELVNESPFGTGWLLRIEVTDASELDNLMSAAEYNLFLASQAQQ